jgi:hypothetical protein
VLVLLFLVPWSPTWGYAAAALLSLSITLTLAGLFLLVWWHVAWKDFWQEKLLEVMALAGKRGDHDLFNRAMFLRNYIESQPDIPVPGSLGFYAVVYSGVQGLLLLASNIIKTT